MIRAKIVGAGGYGGAGIAELLVRHPEADLVCLADAADIGKPLSDLYPHLAGFCDKTLVAYDSPEGREPADVVFFSTPDGVGMRYAKTELEAGAKVIDFSGDFRFDDPAGTPSRINRMVFAPELEAAHVGRGIVAVNTAPDPSGSRKNIGLTPAGAHERKE